MAKSDDILESFDFQNRAVTLISGIEDLIMYAYRDIDEEMKTELIGFLD